MKYIPGYDKKYKIYPDGRVVSIEAGVVLTPSIGNGYKRVNLCHDGLSKTFFVHRLVAMAYIPNPLGLPCVNHKDRNRKNNHASNLEWCTYAENNRHAWQGKKRDKMLVEVRQLFGGGSSVTEIINQFPISVKEALNIKHNIGK